jgi:hypothetical protein
VPVAYLGKEQGWVHQSCERAWKEQQRAHEAAIASAERKRARDIAMVAAERKVRIKHFARIATIGGVFSIATAAKEAVLLLEQYWQ